MGNWNFKTNSIEYKEIHGGGYLSRKKSSRTTLSTSNNYDHMLVETYGLFYVKNSTSNRGEKNKFKEGKE